MLKYRLRNPPNFSDSEVCKITTEFIQKNGVKWPPEKLSEGTKKKTAQKIVVKIFFIKISVLTKKKKDSKSPFQIIVAN